MSKFQDENSKSERPNGERNMDFAVNNENVMNSQFSISHLDCINYQLREPVSSIFAALPILAENINNMDIHKANANLQALYEKSYMLLKNINNITLAAKLLEKGELQSDVLDFSLLVKSIFESAKMVLPSYITIKCDIQDNIAVRCNKSIISNLLLNILLNSLDYRKEDNLIVTVSVKNVDNKCILTYRDNSLGIKPEIVSDVFKPYFTNNPYNDGEISTKMGLGLYIVKAGIEAFSGRVFLESQFGEGVNIVISVPASSEDITVLKSKVSDFVINRYSEMFVQLSEYCTLPSII